MTSYEILLMLDPDQAETRQDEIIAHSRDIVEKGGGRWQSHDAWGRRRLAYPIAKKEEGVYHLLVFDSDGTTLDEVSRVLKIDDAVLRHMATRHIAGSRTGAPRDDGSAPPAPATPVEPAPAAPADEAPAAEAPADEAPADDAPADVSASEEPEYAPTEEEPAEVPAEEEE